MAKKSSLKATSVVGSAKNVPAVGTQRKKIVALIVFLLLGLGMSGLLAYKHYAPEGENDFCKFGKSFDCGIVNKSPYSELGGIFYLMAVDWGWSFVPQFMLEIGIPVALMESVVLIFSLYIAFKWYRGEQPFGWEGKKALTVLRVLFIMSL